MEYGLLSYSTTNLGDEIQSLAALQFLPRVDKFVDRDVIGAAPPRRNSQPLRIVVNGWFMHAPGLWPPAPASETLLTSIHISRLMSRGMTEPPPKVMLTDPNVQYLRDRAPIGARDHPTLTMLREVGIDSYLSGCLTLTLRGAGGPRRTDLLVLADVPKAVRDAVQDRTRKHVLEVSHVTPARYRPLWRLRRAQRLVSLYERASCVVTSRLHCVLPCLALGTPVLLVTAKEQEPQTTGRDIAVRREGLSHLFHWSSVDEFVRNTASYDVDSPPPNPRAHLEMRADLERRVSSFIQSPHR